MLPPLNGFKLFLVSFMLCVLSSVLLFGFMLQLAEPESFSKADSFTKNSLGSVVAGSLFGFFKFLFVSVFVAGVRASWRWQAIALFIAVLAIPEAWVYYQLFT